MSDFEEFSAYLSYLKGWGACYTALGAAIEAGLRAGLDAPDATLCAFEQVGSGILEQVDGRKLEFMASIHSLTD